MYPASAPVVVAPVPDLRKSAESQSRAVGSLPWPQPEDPAIRVEHRVAEGDAVQEIVSASNQLNCDLIVIGTHGRTGLKRLLTGSVAEGTLREASCPVLTVRTGLRSLTSMPWPPRENPVKSSMYVPAGSSVQSKSLFLVSDVEVVRQIVPAGFDMPDPGIESEIIVHCLEGHLNCTLSGQTHSLEGGELICRPGATHRAGNRECVGAADRHPACCRQIQGPRGRFVVDPCQSIVIPLSSEPRHVPPVRSADCRRFHLSCGRPGRLHAPAAVDGAGANCERRTTPTTRNPTPRRMARIRRRPLKRWP